MEMDHENGFELILTALEKDAKEQLFNQWLHDPAHYEYSFEDYIKELTPYQKASKEEKEDILKRFGGGAFGSI